MKLTSLFRTRWQPMAGLLMLLVASGGWAQRPPDKVDQAMARAASFLVSRQEPDGAYYDRDKGDRDRHETALTSMAVLALVATGHQPADKTKEGESLRRSIDFILRADRQEADGNYGKADNSRMYGHGITTLTLTELLGMGFNKQQDRLLRERSRKAIELILRSQRVPKREARFAGGWRYVPDSADSDLSVSVWQLMALRSAKNAGMEIPKQAIDEAVGYLKRSYYSTQDNKAKSGGAPLGGCAYQPGNKPEFAMASAGLLALIVCGEANSMEAQGSANWLRINRPDPNDRWFLYGMYYYAQAMFQRGGEAAEEASQTVQSLLLPMQQEDGSWLGTQGQELSIGKIYGTSLAMLSLAVKYHYLPIYQR